MSQYNQYAQMYTRITQHCGMKWCPITGKRWQATVPTAL